MKTIIGLDLSLTGTGITRLENRRFTGSRRIEPKTTGVQRLLEIEFWIKKEISDGIFAAAGKENILFVIEDYAFSRANQAHHIGELGGVIRRRLYKEMIPYIEVSPSAVKKFATGKGNVGKDLILMNVFKRWGLEFKTNDEADAFVLAKIGQAFLAEELAEKGKEAEGAELREDLTKFQIEVVRELRKKYGVGGAERKASSRKKTTA